MKFLVDAQLPQHLAIMLRSEGHDVLHTLDLPEGNRTADEQINQLSIEDQRVAITKDADFVNSFLVANRPYGLLLISTGNITNKALMAVLLPQLPSIIEAFEEHRFVELNRASLIVHR